MALVFDKKVYLVGEDKVLKNLNKAIRDIKGRTKIGMAVAGNIIKFESQRRTPVDEGNLKGSAYVSNVAEVSKSVFVVEVGHVADYAAAVHEVEKAVHPVGEYKYLLNAIKETKDRVLAAIRKRAKV